MNSFGMPGSVSGISIVSFLDFTISFFFEDLGVRPEAFFGLGGFIVIVRTNGGAGMENGKFRKREAGGGIERLVGSRR